jgi:hypothetical protein
VTVPSAHVAHTRTSFVLQVIPTSQEVDATTMRSAASTPSLARLCGAFALAALATALLMATELLLPNVSQSGLQQNAARLAILAGILYGAWLGLTRAQFSRQVRLNAWLAIAVLLLVWQSVVWWLALAGAPVLPVAIVLPPLIGLPVALVLASPARGARGLGVAWNVLGILDLVNAVTLGALTTAGELPYPLVLIPAFGVPLPLMLHALSLRQLRRLGRRNSAALPVHTDQLASPLAVQHG